MVALLDGRVERVGVGVQDGRAAVDRTYVRTSSAVRSRRYRRSMPQWIVLLAVAVVGWLLLTVFGGMALGRLLALAERRRSKPV
jgi:hypothetical protein